MAAIAKSPPDLILLEGLQRFCAITASFSNGKCGPGPQTCINFGPQWRTARASSWSIESKETRLRRRDGSRLFVEMHQHAQRSGSD
jgi:hypothetical protein